MRMIFEFGKNGRLRYISHLDLQRFMQRALRRTDLPVAYSQGFNPHPQMAFASALAMGWSSEAELLDVRLTEAVDEDHAREQLAHALSPEMPVYRARLVSDRFPALMAKLVWADYRIDLAGESADAVISAVDSYMKEENVIALRKTKSGEKPADIRKMTALLRVEGRTMYARLMLTEQATVKPDLLLATLAERAGVGPVEARIHRVGLFAYEKDVVVPLMDLPEK